MATKYILAMFFVLLYLLSGKPAKGQTPGSLFGGKSTFAGLHGSQYLTLQNSRDRELNRINKAYVQYLQPLYEKALQDKTTDPALIAVMQDDMYELGIYVGPWWAKRWEIKRQTYGQTKYAKRLYLKPSGTAYVEFVNEDGSARQLWTPWHAVVVIVTPTVIEITNPTDGTTWVLTQRGSNAQVHRYKTNELTAAKARGGVSTPVDEPDIALPLALNK